MASKNKGIDAVSDQSDSEPEDEQIIFTNESNAIDGYQQSTQESSKQ